MASTKRKSYFTNDDLVLLQKAFDLACADLRLGRASLPVREQLGVILFQIAEAGETDCTELRRRAVECLRSTSVREPALHPAVNRHATLTPHRLAMLTPSQRELFAAKRGAVERSEAAEGLAAGSVFDADRH